MSLQKAVMHPSDLINNKQDSLTHSSTSLAVTSLVVFSLVSVLGAVKKNA